VIVISTCRRPTQRISSFAKDLSHSLRSSIMLQRGKMSLGDLEDFATEKGAERLLLVNRWHGGPGEIRLRTAKCEGWQDAYPVVYVKSVKLRREYQIRGNFVAEALTAGQGKAVVDMSRSLSAFFGLPVRSDRGSFCSFHVALDRSARLAVSLTSPAATREVGPSFVVQHLKWTDERSEQDEGRKS